NANAATVHHEQAFSIRRRIFENDAPAIAESLDYLGGALIRLERFDEAQPLLAKALTIREAHRDDAPLALARTLESMAWLYRYSGKYDAAAPFIDRALAIRRRVAPDHPDIGLAIELQGDVLFLEGNIAAGQRAWAEALAILERTLRVDHPM